MVSTFLKGCKAKQYVTYVFFKETKIFTICPFTEKGKNLSLFRSFTIIKFLAALQRNGLGLKEACIISVVWS